MPTGPLERVVRSHFHLVHKFEINVHYAIEVHLGYFKAPPLKSRNHYRIECALWFGLYYSDVLRRPIRVEIHMNYHIAVRHSCVDCRPRVERIDDVRWFWALIPQLRNWMYFYRGRASKHEQCKQRDNVSSGANHAI